MKANFYSSLYIVLLMFYSCNEELNMLVSKDINTNLSLEFEQAKLTIKSMGLDTTFISEWNNYYVVEGDILICKDSINLSKASTRQYRTNYYASDSQIIYVGVDNTIAQNTDWREAIQEVITEYNKNTGLQLRYRETSPTITITKGRIQEIDYCAAGTFPTSYGKPGNKIVINTNFFANIDTYLSYKQKVFLLMHELGHNLGLRHTSGSSEGDGGWGLIQIPGTPISDPGSYMNANTCGNSWFGFSQYDLIGLRYLWPIKHTVSLVSYDDIRVLDGDYLSRSACPNSTSSIFSGWYEDEALTIPWNYGKKITSDIKLYPKWRTKSSTVYFEDTSNDSSSSTFTLSQTTAVVFSIKVGRGLNEWWQISSHTDETFGILAKESTFYKRISMEQYIWNANPETYIVHTEPPIVLDKGTYWLVGAFSGSLGPQYGADLKHGITIASVTY